VLAAAVSAPPSVQERAATLAWAAAVVVTAAVQAMATRPAAGAGLPAAVVPKLERVSDRHSSLAGEVLARGLVMARSVAALAPLLATTMQRAQRTAEQTG